jgi:multidrug efflux system outer membrane protein
MDHQSEMRAMDESSISSAGDGLRARHAHFAQPVQPQRGAALTSCSRRVHVARARLALASRSARAIFIASLALAASACKVGPDYERPEVESPAAFRDVEVADQHASLADLPWWQVFADPRLHELVRTAIANNYDLRIAIARVEEARALAGAAKSQYYPQVNYQGAIGGGKNELFGGPGANGGASQTSALATVNAAWEIDLWGRIRSLNESAQAQLLFAEENRRGVVLALVSEVAQAYFELLELDLQLDIAHRNTEAFAESLRLFSRRYEGGVGSKLDVVRAEAQMSTTASAIPELERQISVKENQISVLLGMNPGPIARTAALVDEAVLPEIPSGVPSFLLERRPDVRAAEAVLRSANAQVGVAKADYFPKISLTGFLGIVSPDVGNVTGSDATAWGLGANALGPLFQGGALDARLEQARAQWAEARANYQRTVLLAFREVSDALVARQRLGAIREQQERAVSANTEAVRLARERYDNGKANYFEVLLAQQDLFPAENALAQTLLNERLTIVSLYQALGGGWQLRDDQWTGAELDENGNPPSADAPPAK